MYVCVWWCFFFLRGGGGPGLILKREEAHFRKKIKVDLMYVTVECEVA